MTESYAYDVDGNRIRKTSGSLVTRTYFPHYEEEQVTVWPYPITAVKHYSFNGMTIAVRRGGTLRYTHTDHLGSSSGQTDTAGNAIVDSYLRYYAYGGLRSGILSASTTDRTFTGQKQDGTGLLYYNARYYDSGLGVFLSPDTLVPDAGRVVDYNRFLYVRGNPLKYSDPSGHYSNEEIMQHYGCEDWACVEAIFQKGSGSYVEGLWGWLYMLQMGEDGYDVFARSGAAAPLISGTFQRSVNGTIQVIHNGNNLPDWVIARIGGSGNRGMYAVDTGEYRNVFTWASTKHQFRIVPSQIDKIGAGLGFVKAGVEFGPAIATNAPHPAIRGVGLVWTVAGRAATVYTDLILPIYETVMGDTSAATDLMVDKTIEASAEVFTPNVAPYVSPATDVVRSIWPSLCWGTQCYGR